MAIKVTGTTVINDARELENIVDAADFVKSANFVEVPDLFIDGAPNDVATEPTITTSEFAIFGGGSDTHASTDWEIERTSDSTTVFSSIGDTTNLTSITVSPALDQGEEYIIRVRHNGTSLGASEYREVTVSTAPFEPTTLGEAGGGGFYMGAITAAGQCYALIVAPNATGCADPCPWKTSNTSTSGACSLVDGFANTYTGLDNSNHPAGNFTATRTINGFSDWYLPAIDELELFYNNGAGAGSNDPLPSGEDFANNRGYWSSTEKSSSNACFFYFGNGGRFDKNKTNGNAVRAARRVPI